MRVPYDTTKHDESQKWPYSADGIATRSMPSTYQISNTPLPSLNSSCSRSRRVNMSSTLCDSGKLHVLSKYSVADAISCCFTCANEQQAKSATDQTTHTHTQTTKTEIQLQRRFRRLRRQLQPLLGAYVSPIYEQHHATSLANHKTTKAKQTKT